MTQVGTIYGEALYDLAKSEDLCDHVLQELSALSQSFRQEPEFLRLLAAHNLPKQERCAILDACFRGKCHIYVLNFLKILTEKGYPRHFSDCCDAYQHRYDLDHGILPVTAVTAFPLNKTQSTKLTEKLGSITGKTIRLENRVDPACLGGIRLDYDGKRLDDTVAHRLDSIRTKLKSTML